MTEPTTPATTTSATTTSPAADDATIGDLEQRAAALAEEPSDLQPFADTPNGSIGPDDGADPATVDVTSPEAVPHATT